MRGGFTLTEMLVALAVMVVAMAVVTNVFSITTRTASMSAAIAESEHLARDFALQITEDLAHCDPAESVLVIHGRTQMAAVTEEKRQARQLQREMIGDPSLISGYDPRYDYTNDWNAAAGSARAQYSDPRADILMFFSNRPTASKSPATNPQQQLSPVQAALQRGVKVSPVQVVYGHAAIDTAVLNGGTWRFAGNPTHIETQPGNISPLPLTKWHLGRRVALLDKSTADMFGHEPLELFDDPHTAGDPPPLWQCHRHRARDYAADYAAFDLDMFLEYCSPYTPTARPLAFLSPYGFQPEFGTGYFAPNALQWNNAFDRNLIWNLLYPVGNSNDPGRHHVATILEQPPGDLRDNLGVHQLPGCAWFQVEILIPEDPRNGLDHPLSVQLRDTPRWVAVEPGHTYVFVPDSKENRDLISTYYATTPRRYPGNFGQVWAPNSPQPGGVMDGSRLDTFAPVIPNQPVNLASQIGLKYNGNTADNRRVRMWPYAIRVTVKVFDPRGRLDSPVTRTIVHRFD